MSTLLNSKEDKVLAYLIRHMAAVREHFPHIAYMKDALNKDDKFMFLEAWNELGREIKIALWVAPSKGGIWTTAERIKMREWNA